MIPPNYPKTCEEVLSQVTTVISQFWPCAAAWSCTKLYSKVDLRSANSRYIPLILPSFHPIWYLGLIFGAVIKYFATCFSHLSTSPTRDLESLLQLRLFLQEFLVHSTDKHWNPSGTPQKKPAWNIDLLSINWQIMRKWGFPLLVQAADSFFLLYPLLQASSKSKQMMIPKLPGNETPVGCLFSGRDEYRTGRWCDSVDSTCCWWKRSCTWNV